MVSGRFLTGFAWGWQTSGLLPDSPSDDDEAAASTDEEDAHRSAGGDSRSSGRGRSSGAVGESSMPRRLPSGVIDTFVASARIAATGTIYDEEVQVRDMMMDFESI